MPQDNMDLIHKVLIVKDADSADLLEKSLNDGFVFLRADKFGDGILATLAKAVKATGIVAPGKMAGAVPFPEDLLGDKGKTK